MLEQLQKIADISQKLVIAGVLGVAGYYVTRDKSIVDMGKACDEMYSTILKYVSENELSEKTEKLLNHRLDRYSRACGNLAPDFVALVKTSWKTPVSAKQDVASAPNDPNAGPSQPNTSPGILSGWVALSRIPADQYKDTNFDTEGSDKVGNFAKGEVIKPRWQVNVRLKNTPVSAGDNPAIGQLVPGDCARIEELATGKLNMWAKVRVTECTSPGP